jgi:Mrp family chromosome partitioning ATPase
MEKIQSAIAKARAARSGEAPAERPVPPATPAAPARPRGASSEIAAAWEALPAFIPPTALMLRNHVLAFEGGAGATPFNMLRTKLLQQMRANNWRRLAITSPGAGCGKSTLALNLAFSLGRQPELRTLVAEMDLRRPSLARMLGLRSGHNFVRVLQGAAQARDHMVRHGPNLAFATNHSAFRNPAELLHAPSVPEALKAIEAAYDPDIFLFDTPPMLAGDETMAFIGQVDCVLLVAAAESTSVKEVDDCERELASQTNVLGVVLNKCRYMGPEYGYSYYG